MSQKNEIEPYQPFFISGLLMSLIGIGIWIVFYQGSLSFYPLEAHAFLMVMGFLFAYINGFLMTAVPKMSQTEAAHPIEIGVGLLMLWLQVPLIFLGDIKLNYAGGFVQILFLMFFIGKRFIKRKANPPKAFVFLPFGLGLAALGSFLLLLPDGAVSLPVVTFARNILFQAFILNLILGIGSRLVPVLTRVQGAIDIRSFQAETFSTYLIPALILNCSFLIESFYNPAVGQYMKFMVIAWMAIKHLKVLKPLQVKGHLALGIRSAILCLALGYLLSAILPAYSIHFLHLSFIGGFALLTILISTRVVLAHGGYDLALEVNHTQLIWFFGLAILIGLLRVSLGFEKQFLKEILWILYAAWVVLCGIWLTSFGKKLFKMKSKGL